MIAANSSQPPIGIADSLAVVGSTANPLNNAAPTLWDLLWLGITFFVIWKGFFSALKIDKTFEKVGGFFEGWGNRIGNFAMKAPLAIPIIGTPGRGQTPLNVLNTVLRPGSLIRGGKLGGFNDANRRAAGSLTKQELTDALRANAATKRSVDAKISQIWNIAAGDPDKKRKVEAILSDIRTETGFDVHDQQSIRDFIQGVKDGGGLPAHINEAQLQSKLEDALDI
jgi:hypothetical protein